MSDVVALDEKTLHTKLVVGDRDSQTVTSGGRPAVAPRISGVRIVELGNVLTRSGLLLELFRDDWADVTITPRQVNWVCMNAGGVTDWHRHTRQTDHLIGVSGIIKLALWDGRPSSPTVNRTDVIRFGGVSPRMVIVPPGVWHALRNEGGELAGYINVFDEPYDYANPDNWRLQPGTVGVPDIL
jgi:dTDP-4-dehydrorhamnose 3,5-epimerase